MMIEKKNQIIVIREKAIFVDRLLATGKLFFLISLSEHFINKKITIYE